MSSLARGDVVVLLMFAGAMTNGPYSLITTAVSADLVCLDELGICASVSFSCLMGRATTNHYAETEKLWLWYLVLLMAQAHLVLYTSFYKITQSLCSSLARSYLPNTGAAVGPFIAGMVSSWTALFVFLMISSFISGAVSVCALVYDVHHTDVSYCSDSACLGSPGRKSGNNIERPCTLHE